MAPQDVELFFGELEHEILGEPLDVPSDCPGKRLCLNLVEASKVCIKHDLVAAYEVNGLKNELTRHTHALRQRASGILRILIGHTRHNLSTLFETSQLEMPKWCLKNRSRILQELSCPSPLNSINDSLT